MHCIEILHITLQFYAVFSSELSFNTARYKAVVYTTVQCDRLKRSTIQYTVLEYTTKQLNITHYSVEMACFDLVSEFWQSDLFQICFHQICNMPT